MSMLNNLKKVRQFREIQQVHRAKSLAQHRFYPVTMFFSGNAGVGKSYMIKQILKRVCRNLYPTEENADINKVFTPAEETGNFLRPKCLFNGQPIIDFRGDPDLKIRHFMSITDKKPDWLYKTPKQIAFRVVLFDGYEHFNTYIQEARPKTVRQHLNVEDFYHRINILAHVYWAVNESGVYRYARIYRIKHVKEPQLINVCHKAANDNETWWSRGTHLSHYVPFPNPSIVEPLDHRYVKQQGMAIQPPMNELENKMRRYPPLLTMHQAIQVLSRYIISCNRNSKLIKRMWENYYK